ncbi:MAG: hypothetical protein QOC99_4043 [Acidobacteriota bacterium]|jgi:hypothetical protein|nr:hypothetical protein [Acidobacteriota bacterium]MDT7781531.1 hypothetical protein [Acidobacteriota bacterium]
MAHTWTIIFVTILVVAFGLAAWLDRQDRRKRERRGASHEERDEPQD